ncbi:unnamed protein product [Ilex paraguariensis]|uniref:peroxidase n=1 Tax=Ilex paraguariensis TaxID=185542 RepID=A0ABC8SWA6_9AQUA
MGFTRTLSFLVFLLCVLISLKNQNVETDKGSQAGFLLLHHNLGRCSCQPSWRRRSKKLMIPDLGDTITRMNRAHKQSKPSDQRSELLVLVDWNFGFGCDPSVLLDATDGIDSENESPPKESLKGFVDLIDVIKSELEEAHPGVVSCAHVVVFAARESVLLLYNFVGTDEPDPPKDTEFLNLVRSRCNNHVSLSPLSSSSTTPSPAIDS